MVVLSFLATGAVAAYSGSFLGAVTFAFSSLLAAAFFAVYCFRKIGGITGDCVGAANELVEITALLCAMLIR